MKKELGRKPNIRKIKLAKRYRKLGLPYRAIAYLLAKNDLKQAYRWANYPDDILEAKSKRGQRGRA